MRFLLAIIVMLLAPVQAHAAWHQASSAHFVVYANDSENNVRKFSERLERYHAAMKFLTNSKLPPPSPSNRVTVFVVGSMGAVRKIEGSGNENIAGFYDARAGGSYAVVPQVRSSGTGEPDFSLIVLLHEYAHHFLISSSAFTLPGWLSEGRAEFFASANFGSDGSVGLGRPAYHRAGELLYAKDVTANELLDDAAYAKRKRGKVGDDAFYGKSWLLVHYLTFEPARKGQLEKYEAALQSGKSSRDAAQEAFGDFKLLERELDQYLNRSRVTTFKLPAHLIVPGPITVRALREGEAAIMPVMIRSRRGVDEKTAPLLLADARAVAAKFPADPAVQAALAEAEFDAGNDREAIAAADAAIKADPTQVNAYVQKGYALFHLAKSSDATDALKKARAPFVALNGIEPDHPLPLVYFYRSFVDGGVTPSDLAIRGLERAVDLAPFDKNIRLTLVMQYIRSGKIALARAHLKPLSFDPHGEGYAEVAGRITARLDADPKWDGKDMPDLEEAAVAPKKEPAK